MKNSAMKVLLASALLMLSSLVHAGGIDRLQSFLNTTKSASGSFEQSVEIDAKSVPEQAGQGTFAFLRPGCFRWHYQRPDEALMISNGKKLWYYDTLLEQVTVKNLTQALPATPASILFGEENIQRDFTLKELPRERGLEWVLATPKQTDSPFKSIAIGLNQKGPAVMVIEDHFHQKTRLTLSNMKINEPLKVRDFEFKVPENVQVLNDPSAF